MDSAKVVTMPAVKPVIKLTNTCRQIARAHLSAVGQQIALHIAAETFGWSDGREWLNATQAEIAGDLQLQKASVCRAMADLINANVVTFDAEHGYQINTSYADWCTGKRKERGRRCQTDNTNNRCQTDNQLSNRQQPSCQTDNYIYKEDSTTDSKYGLCNLANAKSHKPTPEKNSGGAGAGGKASAKQKKSKKREPLTQGFDEFKAAYPKAGGRSFDWRDALKAWKAHKCYQHAAAIVADIARRTDQAAGDWQWLKDAGKFIPGPGPYLRAAKWSESWQGIDRLQLAERQEIYNRECPKFKPCHTLLTNSRIDAMAWLVDCKHLPTLEQWTDYCKYLHTVKRLRGEAPNRSGEMRKADIDLILRQDFFVKAWEGVQHGGI